MTTNPLVAAATDTPPSVWAGAWICEDIELIAQGLRGGSWIDGSLGVVSAGLDALALVSDPVGALVQYGIAWLIEHVKPLSEALDWLAGDPAAITAHAQTWRNVAGSLREEVATLAHAVRADVATWGGSAGPAYRAWASEQQQAISGLARGADALAAITEGAAGLVAAVRLLVRDAVAACVSRLIVYAGELLVTGGLAAPLVAEQVSTLVASWGARIARLLRALLNSLRRLMPEIRRLGDLIDRLKQALGRLQHRSPDPHGPDSPGPTKTPGDLDRPDFTDAEIDPRKITTYAMNPDHPVGKNKYRVINSATGLGPEDADMIMQQIREGVLAGSPVLGKADQFGERWSVDLPLTGPSGVITVRTAWILEDGAPAPRMVTISFPPKEG
ncbi:WXG100 family type VII secretion target [Micromonospora sp. WMMD1120]|uniref:WXG100 family type VII secretion target n=1 Tax=Micromonospora sp. WMMD1120 TaxID=3016106 RepID=UPI002416F6B8|nr:WXG100 family type VII secretion target [Micromonospora sp. WMMD1120]MDG4810585.1 WXG100 family type VII secretion target [Micromonospora sp. WMMD1120]